MAQHLLPSPVPANLVRLCPTMNLLAIAIDDKTVEVYRFDGSRSFASRRAPNLKPPGLGSFPAESGPATAITAIEWRYDGLSLIVAHADGLIDIVDAKTGKVSQRHWELPVGDAEEPRKIERLSTSYVILDPTELQSQRIGNRLTQTRARQRRFQAKVVTTEQGLGKSGTQMQDDVPSVENWDTEVNMESLSLEDVSSLAPDPRALATFANLPKVIANLDVESALPKLSPLEFVRDAAIVSWDVEKFTSQGEIDRRFNPELHSSAPAHDALHASFVVREDSSIGTLLHEIHSAGDAFSTDKDDSSTRHIVGLASHPFSNETVVVTETQTLSHPERKALHIHLADLQGLRQSPHLLRLAIQKTYALQEICQYITQTILSLRSHWTTCQEVPKRYIRNINITLEEKDDKVGLVGLLYSLAVTGHCSPEIREWIVDILGEHVRPLHPDPSKPLSTNIPIQGYKRWEAALLNGYASIITSIHQHLIPALTRASALTIRLRVLSRHPGRFPAFAVPADHLTRVLATLDLLRTAAHRALTHALTEQRQARVFVGWLHATIGFLSAENPAGQQAEECAEKAAATDFSQLLPYLSGALTRSHLAYLLGTPSADVARADRRPATQLRQPVAEQILERHARVCLQPAPGAPPPAVDLLLQALRLLDDAHVVAVAVPTGLQRSVRLATPPAQIARDGLLCDTVLVAEAPDRATVYAATLPAPNASVVSVHRLVFETNPTPDVEDGGKSRAGFLVREELRIAAPDGYEVRDAKFVDDDRLALLLGGRDASVLAVPAFSVRARAVAKEEPLWEGENGEGMTAEEEVQVRDRGLQQLDAARLGALGVEYKHPAGVGEFVPAKMMVRPSVGADDDGEQDGKIVAVLLERDGARWEVVTGSV